MDRIQAPERRSGQQISGGHGDRRYDWPGQNPVPGHDDGRRINGACVACQVWLVCGVECTLHLGDRELGCEQRRDAVGCENLVQGG